MISRALDAVPYFFLKKKGKKFNKHLVGSKKSCTFALAFEKDEKMRLSRI